MTQNTPDRATAYAIAAKANADYRTVLRYLRGEIVRGDVAKRIAAAIVEAERVA